MSCTGTNRCCWRMPGNKLLMMRASKSTSTSLGNSCYPRLSHKLPCKFRCPPTHLEAQSQSLWQDGMARGARRLGGFTAAVPLRAVLRQGACRAVSAQNQGIKAFQLSTAPPGACRAAPLAGSRVARTGPHNRQSSDLGWLPPVGRECRSGLRGTGGPLGWHRRCGCHQ